MSAAGASQWDRDACAAPHVLDLSKADRALFRDFVREAAEALPWIASIAGTPSVDPEDVDAAYRKLNFILGFCRVWGLGKAVEILKPALIAFEAGRLERNFERGSMDYVIRLSTNCATAILQDLAKKGVCDTDISESAEECFRYIDAYEQMRKRALEESVRPEKELAGPARSAPPALAGTPQGTSPGDAYFKDFVETTNFTSEQSSLIDEFCAESGDDLARVGQILLDLENSPGDTQLVNDVFRAVHTVKGGARLIGVRKIEALAHEMETLLSELRSGDRDADGETIDVLIAGNAALQRMVEEIAAREPIRTEFAGLIGSIHRLRGKSSPAAITPAVAMHAGASSPAPGGEAPTPVIGAEDTLRVPTSKLDDVLNTASEVFVTRIRLQADVAGLTQAVGDLQDSAKLHENDGLSERLQRLRQSLSRLETTLVSGSGNGSDRGSLLVIVRDALGGICDYDEGTAATELRLGLEKVDLLRKQLQKDLMSLEALSSRLQSGAMNFRMVPVAQLFSRFPVLVREMARSLGKRVTLETQGNTTELDKVLIGQLFDPLLHILRNAVDHGVESPHERLAGGKSEIGKIRLSAYYEGSYVVLEVTDDGRGLDTAAISARAIERGLITPERAAQMSQADLIALIFEPGFSTRTAVSEVSGRGVGMDVVKTAVQQMQGVVTLDTAPGKSTTIRIKAPVTLAVVGVVLVEERGYHFAVPVLSITEILSVARTEIRDIAGAMAMNFRGRAIPITSLSAVMKFPASAFIDESLSVVVIHDGEREIGLLVDSLLGRQDVLIKQFGNLLRSLPFLMGCTILSDSRLVCVLDVIEIIRHGRQLSRAEQGGQGQASRFASRRQHIVLVVDDSPIQRNRLTAALERSGYKTLTAEDGFDALTKIRRGSFAACCVDVLMPLIDGFEFVERLRLMPEVSDVPVYMMSGRRLDHGFDQHRLDRLGVRGFFHKPFNVDDLVEALDRDLLDEGVVSNPTDAQPGQKEGMPL